MYAYCLKYHLFEPGPVVVAVSGGADSLTLLHVLMTLRSRLGISLHVATFDHQIRGAASADDCRFVTALATAWGLTVTAGSADVPALAREWGMGLEAAARKARYTFLAGVARQIRTDQLALGHNQDDQAETVLMHVIRGTGLAGLRGMLPRTREPHLDLIVIRPLLETLRTEIDAYLRDLGIEPCNDQTNADTTYTRNRLRHEVMPLLEAINPQVRKALARTAALAREDYEALHSITPSLEQHDTELSIDRATFLALPPGQQRLLIRLAVQQIAPQLELGYERTADATALVAEHVDRGSKSLGGTVQLRVANNRITVFDTTGFPDNCPWIETQSSVAIRGAGTFTLPGGGWLLEVERLDFVPTSYDLGPLSTYLALPDEALVTLRTRTAGDRFRPHGSGGHSQKLSDSLINMKVRAHWRGRMPLLIVDGEIAWFVAPTPDGPRGRIAEQFAVQQCDQRPVWRFSFRAAGR